MSLHTLAQHLQSAGRGDDKVLVHMTPNEVQGLQSLAMAHGGSLTINPETGLPEAGFLRAILPMLAGAALTIGSGGAINPLTASFIVGGGTAAATGSLQQGLMAGLGAYGGAGLGGGLTAAGAAGAQGVSAGTQAVNNMSSGMTTVQAPAAAATAAMPPGLAAATTGQGFAVQPTISTTAQAAATRVPATMGGYAQSAQGFDGLGSAAPASVVGPQAAPSVAGSISDRFAQAGRGFQNITSDTDKFVDFLSEQKKPLIAAGIGTLGMYQPKVARPPEEEPYVYTPFDYVRPYNPSALPPGSTAERSYFRAAEGGMMSLPVENMSRQNASMDNNRYPMALQQTPTYANPSERPISQNVIYPATDVDVTPYSGTQKMAGGGVVALAAGGPTAADIQAGQNAIKTELTWLNTNIKPFDPNSVAEPKGGFTNTNVYATYSPSLTTQRNEVMNTRARLKQYIDAKGNPKPGYEDVVDILRNAVEQQTSELQQLVDLAYNKIPRTDLDYSDPKKAAAITTAQTNEEAQVNALLANFVNNVDTVPGIQGLAGSDFAKDIKAKLDAETAQKQEAAIFQTNIAPILAGVKDKPSPADSMKLATAMLNAGLIDKQGNLTAKGNQYSGLASFAQDTLKAYQEGEKPLERTGQSLPQFAPKIPASVTTAWQAWNTTARDLTAADVTFAFEEVVGRKPTGAELQQYVGTRTTMPAFTVGLASNAGLDSALTRIRPFTADEIQSQAKYYWGREMDDGELAAFVRAANAGSYPSFNHLRNALTSYVDRNGKSVYKENLSNRLDAINKPPPTGPSSVEIADVYGEVLGRKPTKAEFDQAVEAKTPVAALRTNLLNSKEYLEKRIYQPEAQPSGVGGSGFAVQQPSGNVATTGTTTGITTLPGATQISSGAGFDTAPRQPTPEEIAAEQAATAAYQQRYMGYTPTGGGIARPVMDEKMQQDIATVAGNVYRPQFLPASETPDIRFIRDVTGQAFPYRDPNKELGLTGLYSQLSQKMPDLRQGLTFTPSQGAVLAAPFSNVTPGLVTLQSAAAPQPYTPPTPVIPGTQTQSVALTPEEQVLLAQAQALQQNQPKTMAAGGYAGGGYHLGDYSDGGRLLKGPGDGVSDSIPASIGNRQPARLADGEFVIPARIVSELGNGSTDAGARQLYAMMDRIQKRRRKSVGKGRVAVDSKARALLPA